ncbi:MAG TPA: GNAT family N-acetyltransferase [Gammaproteobacteria bacterium]|jgi:ribosomal protein S18 acetylase RimI-like enzyme
MQQPIQITEDPSGEVEAFLGERIYEFNSAATGLFDGEGYAATIRDPQGRIVAGVNGHTWGGCCYVAQLWVHESARHRGLGSSLLHAVEVHARGRGCSQVVLSSHDFQAPDLYRRLGYVECARIADYPRGHSDIIFTKRL